MSNWGTQATNRYVVWNGEKRKYKMWKLKFMVNYRSRKVHEGFELNKNYFPVKPEELASKEEKEKFVSDVEQIINKNNKSFDHLINSIDHNKEMGTLALGYVFGVRTSRFLGGSARVALERLNNRYDKRTR